MSNFTIRKATENDCYLILNFIKAHADYEKMADQVTADENLLKKWLFDERIAEVVFACENGKEVGFALFFHNFSTFLGKAGLYLEDLFVLPDYRGKGYGIGLLKYLAKLSLERGYGRFEWCCLDWNKPSIDLYLAMGAKKMDEWTTYRLCGKELENFAKD